MENERCDCHSAKMFPHRRKKCALGLGKSPDAAPSPVLQPSSPLLQSPAQQQHTNHIQTHQRQPYTAQTTIPQAVVVMDGDFGGSEGDGDGLQFVQPLNAPQPQINASNPSAKPSLGSRLVEAFENGLVSGTYLGTTSGTAHVVREAVINTSHAVIESLSSKKK